MCASPSFGAAIASSACTIATTAHRCSRFMPQHYVVTSEVSGIIDSMPPARSTQDRLTEATLSGLSMRLVTDQTPHEDAIAQIHAESTDPTLLSRVAGHQLARADTDPRMAPRYRAAAELLIAAGGTDRAAGQRARADALRLGGQRPPDAWRPRSGT